MGCSPHFQTWFERQGCQMRHKINRLLKRDIQRIEANADAARKSRSLPPALLALPQGIHPKKNRAAKRSSRPPFLRSGPQVSPERQFTRTGKPLQVENRHVVWGEVSPRPFTLSRAPGEIHLNIAPEVSIPFDSKGLRVFLSHRAPPRMEYVGF